MGFLYETLSILVIINLCGLSQQQDQQNYFYTQNQGRFIPSYQQNPRNSGYFGQAAQPRNPQPGSFQEQTLYVGATGGNTGQGGGQLPPDSSTSAYFPFQPYTTTRHPELFEISPRPFSGQALRNNGGFQYQRIPPTPPAAPGAVPLPPQPLVPDFPPRNLPPHQAADLFLNQIGLEQGHPGDIPNTRQFSRGQQYRQEAAVNRDVSPPSRTDKATNTRNSGAFKASVADDYLTSHEETFRSRNRYRGNGVSTTEVPVETSKNVRGKATKRIPPDAIELTRKAPPARTLQKELLLNEQLLRSRPVPYDQPEATPFPKHPEPPKINISHNGSTKQSNELPTLEENYPDYYYDTGDESLMAKIKNPNVSQPQVDPQPEKPAEKKPEIKEESTSQEQINPNVYVPNIQSLHDTSKHIRDNKASLEEKLNVPKATEAPKTEIVTEKEENPEDHTVILTSNFYLPENFPKDEVVEDNQNSDNTSQSVLEEDEEYEYEDYGEDEEDANIPQITTASPTVETTTEKSDGILGEAVISVVTTRSTMNGSTGSTDAEESETPSNIASPINSENMSTTTESWVVIASVQTSRSVSGARFLPFPQVEQEEKKQVLSDLDKEQKSEEDTLDDDLLERNIGNSTPDQDDEITTIPNTEEPKTDSAPEATSHSSSASHGSPQSTESIIDKLDRVQSELSSGVLTGKFPILNETLEDITTKSTPSVIVKKFSPRTTTTTPTPTTTAKRPEIKKLVFDSLPMDDLAALLPAGYKSRASYKNKKITTTTAAPEVKTTAGLASLMNNILVKDVSVLGLLPKDYKVNVTTTQEPPKSPADVILQKAQKVDISAFLPSGYLASSTTPKVNTKKPLTVTVEDDISKFLPPGYKLPKTTKMPSTTSTAAPAIPIVDDISKFLPPGFKFNETKVEAVDISKFLPANYTEKPKETITPPPAPSSTTVAPKVVFPSRPGFLAKKPGQRPTTAKPVELAGPAAPDVTIRHGPPTRATTEFTGWPTPSTTPLSIEKILERQRTSTIDPPDFFSASTTTRTTTTTTTKATTQRPTEPSVCPSDCDLAGTIKIIGGVTWKPELLDHNTDEWKSLAREMETQLNSVYGKHPELSKWFQKVRIDSFSQGSVLVDYFVELSNMPRHINTLELKKLFHSALTTVTTEPPEYTTEFDADAQQTDSELDDEFGPIVRERVIEPKVATKETLRLGHFIIDPISTDFIVLQKQVAPTVEFAEENQFLPQWAIAVIVIGVGSLLFVIVFGVTVLLNRKNKAKKKAPAPLTTDMLNELNKNHMGGVENYGHEEFYNIEDTWDDETDTRHHDGIKSKRYGHPMHNSTQSNIYDSWRSQRHPGYYYDSHPNYPQKVGPYPADAFMDYHQAPTQHNSMPMYTYNPRRYRDYDEDF